MAQRPAQSGMVAEDWQRLQELLSEAQQEGLVGDALQLIGLEEDAAQWVSEEVDHAVNQSVIQPKAKAKVASRNPADYATAAATMGYEVVGQDTPGAMTDASKRLHDDAIGDLSTEQQTSTHVVNSDAAAMPKMNRVRRALMANNTEAMSLGSDSSRQHSETRQMGAAARSGQVPRVEMTSWEALRAANPVVSLQEAQRMYPSIDPNGGGYVATPTGPMNNVAASSAGKGSGRTRYALVEDNPTGLREYVHYQPPTGRVRELWHLQNPLNDEVPMPHGIGTMAAWGDVVVTMEKHKGLTFRQVLDRLINGDREMAKYCGWIISRYGKDISRTPASQAPDLAAYLLRSGWDPDSRAPPLTYVRTFSTYREA